MDGAPGRWWWKPEDKSKTRFGLAKGGGGEADFSTALLANARAASVEITVAGFG
jgi:hypothetical protein